MDLETTPPFRWPFIHPMALLWLLFKLPASFAELITECMDKSPSGLRIVIFVDEFTPGNVLRPDRGRAMQHVLWAFVDWPEWVLCRATSWLTFGCIRTSLLASLPGGMSNFMKNVNGVLQLHRCELPDRRRVEHTSWAVIA